MLAGKQIWTELKYTKKAGQLVVVIPLTLCAAFFIREWTLVYAMLAGYMEYLVRWNRLRGVPEILCFLPMGREERKRYARRKGGLIGTVFGVYLTVCLLFSCIPYEDGQVNRMEVSCMLAVGISYLLKTRERIVAEENAVYRRYEPFLYRQECCPLWYREMYGIAAVLRAVLLAVSFFWCNLYDLAEGNPADERQWCVGLAAGLAVLLILHSLMMRHSISIVDMGDYNGKRDKAVEHEY